MTVNSKIEWTDHTFNPWTGCTKISPGCDHCYAEGWAKRSGHVEWGGQRRRTTISYWQQPFKWNDAAKAEGRRRRVFCASLADVFDNTVIHEWRADLFRLIRSTPDLDWLLLTKRIGNAAAMIEQAMRDIGVGEHFRPDVPWQNVWIGATVVNQTEAERDVPKLLEVPARVRFLSCEPLLGPIDFHRVHDLTARDVPCCNEPGCEWCDGTGQRREGPRPDWIIVGGESGSHARPMFTEWARDILDFCHETDSSFFMKQGSKANWPWFKDFDSFPPDLQVRNFPEAA